MTLQSEMQKVKTPHLVRIAAVHHHVLPVAHTAGRIVGAEPLMVLQNAGNLLGILAHHRFDLVLHGHKHRAQFSRIDFAPDSAEGYPIAVAGAGSAAMSSSNPRANSFNLITIEPNGRIIIQGLHYGASDGPDISGLEGDSMRTFTETIEATKRRAFIRASQRHDIATKRRVLHFVISEHGDLEFTDRTEGLQGGERTLILLGGHD